MSFRNHEPRPFITTPSPEERIIPNKPPILNALIQMKNDSKSQTLRKKPNPAYRELEKEW